MLRHFPGKGVVHRVGAERDAEAPRWSAQSPSSRSRLSWCLCRKLSVLKEALCGRCWPSRPVLLILKGVMMNHPVPPKSRASRASAAPRALLHPPAARCRVPRVYFFDSGSHFWIFELRGQATICRQVRAYRCCKGPRLPAMRLPRLSPFARASEEIPRLYSLLYPSPSAPPCARQEGVDLVQDVYLPKGGCPVAIECTASLVSCTILDDHFCAMSGGGTGRELPAHLALSLRQTLSLALIRLVNSLSDSLQSGPYARSIAHIAESQLGMPSWFVEFRHRATHEELPSLEVCRSVVGAALGWLEGVYWRPMCARLAMQRQDRGGDEEMRVENEQPPASTSAPTSASEWWRSSTTQQHGFKDLLTVQEEAPQTVADVVNASIPTLDLTVKAYKRIAKLVARDESLRGPSRAELQGVYAEVDRWIARRVREVEHMQDRLRLESRNDSGGGGRSRGYGGDRDEDSDEDVDADDDVTAQAQVLRHVFDYLLQPGGLIPLSKSKRAKWAATKATSRKDRDLTSTSTLPTLPRELIRTWTPLLIHLTRNWEGVGDALIAALGQVMFGDIAEESESITTTTSSGLFLSDKSYRSTCLAWVGIVVPPTASSDVEAEELQSALRQPHQSVTNLLRESLITATTTTAATTTRGKALLPLIAHLVEVVKQHDGSSDDGGGSMMWEEMAALVRIRLSRETKQRSRKRDVNGHGHGMNGAVLDGGGELLKGFEDMDDGSSSRTAMMPASSTNVDADEDDDADADAAVIVGEMQGRYEDVLRLLRGESGEQEGDERQEADEEMDTEEADPQGISALAPKAAAVDTLANVVLPRGWSVPSDAEWTPAPIGCAS